MSKYLEGITGILSRIETEEQAAISRAAALVSDVLKADGLIYVFGCGHSHLPGLDAFYRAGGLANVSPMLDTDLMLHNGAVKSSRMEKLGGIGAEIFRRYVPQKKDMLIVFSASGKNLVPVEVLRAAKMTGVPSVGVSSSEYFGRGGVVHENCDIHIDCKVPYGDAIIEVGGAKMGGLSTAASCFILNTVLIEGARLAHESDVSLPVYLSGNIDGGRAHNERLEDMYLGRVKHL